MEYYDRDGESVEIQPILGNGKAGQTLVLANVSLSKGNPLVNYPQPYVFTIVEKVNGEKRVDGYYVIRDAEGRQIKIRDDHYGASSWYLFDANEYLRWASGKHKEDIRRKDAAIARLKEDVKLLRGIMERQGIRVITKEQAKELGL